LAWITGNFIFYVGNTLSAENNWTKTQTFNGVDFGNGTNINKTDGQLNFFLTIN
jgi:hypothetical protein